MDSVLARQLPSSRMVLLKQSRWGNDEPGLTNTQHI